MAFGSVGAIVGVNGKKKTYYHCPDCGVTLSYCMGQLTTNKINEYISNPAVHEEALKSLKQIYPNIGWSNSDLYNENLSGPEHTQSDHSQLYSLAAPIPDLKEYPDEKTENIFYNRILTYHNISKCKQTSINELRDVLGEKNYSGEKQADFMTYLYGASQKLVSKFIASINDEDEIVFLNKEESKKLASRALNRQILIDTLGKYKDILSKSLIDTMEADIWITYEEERALFNEIVFSNNITDDLSLAERLLKEINFSLCNSQDIFEKKLENGQLIYARLTPKSKASVLEQRKTDEQNSSASLVNMAINKIKEKENETKKVFPLLKKDFQNNGEYTYKQVRHMIFSDSTLKALYSNYDDINDILNWCIYFNYLEKNKNTYCLPGAHQLNQSQTITEKENSLNQIQANINHELLSQKNKIDEKERQKQIYNDNAKKIFGAGAKLRKQAQISIDQLSVELDEIAVKISNYKKESDALIKEIADLKACNASTPVLYDSISETALSSEEQNNINTLLELFQKYGTPLTLEMLTTYSNSCEPLNGNKVKINHSLNLMMDNNLLMNFNVNCESDSNPVEFFIPFHA